jgi:hypothetical protein
MDNPLQRLLASAFPRFKSEWLSAYTKLTLHKTIIKHTMTSSGNFRQMLICYNCKTMKTLQEAHRHAICSWLSEFRKNDFVTFMQKSYKIMKMKISGFLGQGEAQDRKYKRLDFTAVKCSTFQMSMCRYSKLRHSLQYMSWTDKGHSYVVYVSVFKATHIHSYIYTYTHTYIHMYIHVYAVFVVSSLIKHKQAYHTSPAVWCDCLQFVIVEVLMKA